MRPADFDIKRIIDELLDSGDLINDNSLFGSCGLEGAIKRAYPDMNWIDLTLQEDYEIRLAYVQNSRGKRGWWIEESDDGDDIIQYLA